MHHYIFIISQLWLTSHPRSTVVLLDTQELLVPAEQFTVRMPIVRFELAAPRLKPSALAIELNSSKAIAGKDLTLSSWCIASLYIYQFSTVVDFSFEK